MAWYVFFIGFIIYFVGREDKNMGIIMNILQADWEDTVDTNLDYQNVNNGMIDSRPFNDLLVMDANISINGSYVYNRCPTYKEHQVKEGHNDTNSLDF